MAQKDPIKDGNRKPSNDDRSKPPSVKQIDVAVWLAEYKETELPEKARTSERHWWGWINSTLTRIDYEDARAAELDYELSVNCDDPVSVIGALRYRDTATTPSPDEEAVKMLLNGIHPYTVEDNLMLTQEQISKAVKEVELGGYEIQWGSV